MRSAGTARRWPATSRLRSVDRALDVGRGRRLARSWWSAVAALPVLLVLAGCGGGSVNEARLGAARDAVASPRLDQQEATSTAREFFPPTPTPGPELPPPPTLESLVVTLGIGAGDSPQQNLASIPADTGTVYASAQLLGLVAGQRIDAVWTDAVSNEVGRSEQSVVANAGQQWVSLPLAVNGRLAPGDYAVYLFADGRRLGSVVFVVAPAGSVAQEFPPPPDNPRVSAQPTAAADRRGGQSRDQGGGGVVDPGVAGQAPTTPADGGAGIVSDPNAGPVVPPTYPPQ